MKTYTNRPPGFFKLAAMATIGFVATTVFVQGAAFATTAANAIISNTATVSYDDSAGNFQGTIDASVNVTVNLVEATPSFTTPPADQSVFSTSPASYIYTITANANGVDTYNLTSTQTAADAGITVNTRVFRNILDTADITDITLGATSVATGVTITAAGTTAVTVPSDGAADASLNGLVAGMTVVVNGQEHTVASITDNDNTVATSTLVLNGNGADNVVTVGMQIGQRAQFIFRVTPTTTVDSGTVTNEVSARDDASAEAAATDSTITTVLLAPSLTVTKYVRNITAGTTGAGACININTGLDANPAVDYCVGATTGQPGDVLEYVIEIVNGASAGEASDVVISDPIPAFTTQTGNIALDPGTGTWSNVATTADNGDFAEIVGNIVYIYAGDGTAANEGEDNGGTSGDGNGEGGRLATGATTRGAFRVTIDN